MKKSISISLMFSVMLSLLAMAPASALAVVQKEIFGLYSGGYRIQRYDVTANTFLDCGPVFTTGSKTIGDIPQINSLASIGDPGCGLIYPFEPADRKRPHWPVVRQDICLFFMFHSQR